MMREQILEIVNREDKALSVEELLERMNLSSVEEFKSLLRELNALEDELFIYRTNKNKYMKFSNSNLRLGKVLATKKGYGFVDIEGDEDVFIPEAYITLFMGIRLLLKLLLKKELI